jgi:hypothetical protein
VKQPPGGEWEDVMLEISSFTHTLVSTPP